MGVCSLPSLLLLWLLLLLRGTFAAPVQGKAASPPCDDLRGGLTHKESQRCCQRCPTGFTPKVRCPRDPQRDCEKPCLPGLFLDYQHATPRCEYCVTCSPERNLVQKVPCTHNSSGVCECRPGLYCQTTIPNTCARCMPLTRCKPGFGVKIRGSSDQDTVCEECPLGTFSEKDSSTETCQPRAVSSSLEKVAEEKSHSVQDAPGMSLPLNRTAPPPTILGPSDRTRALVRLLSPDLPDLTTRQPVNESSTRRLPEPSRRGEDEQDVTFLATALLLAFLLLAVLVVLWKKRACRKWIVPHRVKIPVSSQAKICATGTLSPAEKGPEWIPESFSGSLLEMEETPSLDPEGNELLQAEVGMLVEPTVRSHTNNCIEKIYIMRADTVIVGSVVPSGKSSPSRGEEGICGAQEAAEGSDVDMHYPEQETELSPGSDITTPVEEEWEFPGSFLANEKPLERQEEGPNEPLTS